MTSTDPKDREVETGLYAALRNREREIEELKEELKTLRQVAEDFAHEKKELIRERDLLIEEHTTLAAHWRVQTNKRLTQDKYEPPRVAREFARYNWTQHGMMRENPGASHGDWVWCSVADILAFEDERAGMIARIEVLEQQDRKLRADKIVMPRYMSVTDPRLTLANTHRAQGFNSCIAAWFKLNPSVEVTVEPEEKQL